MNICIVEDNKSLLDNLRILLAGEPGFTVSGAYASAEQALRSDAWGGVDALLSDIDLPGMSGVELIRKALALNPRLQIMAYTVFEDRETVFAAIKAGAAGYLLKGCSPRELVEGLRELCRGGAPMSPKIARKVIRELQTPGSDAGGEGLLTAREKGILSAIGLGRSYKEIAADFNISPHTVHTHIKNIYEKLHAVSRADALQKARDLRVI